MPLAQKRFKIQCVFLTSTDNIAGRFLFLYLHLQLCQSAKLTDSHNYKISYNNRSIKKEYCINENTHIKQKSCAMSMTQALSLCLYRYVLF